MSAETNIMRSVVDGAKRVTKAEPVRDGVILVNGATLKPEPISWLWDDWVAPGKLHLIAGPPGQGKTTIALAFAATVTSGGRWPDGSSCPVGNVLVWSGEDGLNDTLLPRLLAAGAAPERVYFVTGSRVKGTINPFDPSRDLRALTEQCERIGNVRLIIVDPVVSVVTGDSHKNTETRRALQPLVDLAASMDAALIGITHFSKGGQGSDPAQRLAGSIAFPAVARVVLVAAKVKSEGGEDRRILARAKSNIGPDGGGFEYYLEQCEAVPGIFASRIAWGASLAGTAQELLTDPFEGNSGGKSALHSAAEFLRDVLGNEMVPMKSVETKAEATGIAWRTVRRAAGMLGVKKRKLDVWYWTMPKPPIMTKLANMSDVEKLDTLATFRPSVNEDVGEYPATVP